MLHHLSPGSALSAAEDLKKQKYSQLVADIEFVPVAVETSAVRNESAVFV